MRHCKLYDKYICIKPTKMIRYTLSFLFAAMLATNANAQVTFGPEASLNISAYRIKLPEITGATFSKSAVAGMRIGGIADIPLSDHVSIQPGASFAMNGMHITYTIAFAGSIDIIARTNTLQIPLNVQYKFGKPEGSHFFVGAGPYMGINMSGTTKFKAAVNVFTYSLDSTTTTKMDIGPDSTDLMKRLDFGAGVNAGYQLAMGLYARAWYQMGFRNMVPAGGDNNSIKTINYGISIGYMFGGKNRKAKTTGAGQ